MPPEVLEMGIPLLRYTPNITPDKIEELRRTFAFFKKKGRIHGEEPDWKNLIDTGYLEKAQVIRK